jgi:hypothetical protein
MGSVKGLNIWPMKKQSYNTSFVACVTAIYSLSIIESEIISCCLDNHETAPLLIKKVYPEAALLFSAILPSASAYPVKTFSSPP